MKEESCFRKLGGDLENPRSPYVAQRHSPESTHDARSRQLPTNENLASLGSATNLTREYQFDSSSIYAGLSGSGLFAGP